MIRLTRIPMSRREGKDARAYGLVIAEATVPRQQIEATSVRPTRKKADHPHEQERGTSSKISLPPCPTDEGRKRSLSMHKYLRKERTSKKKGIQPPFLSYFSSSCVGSSSSFFCGSGVGFECSSSFTNSSSPSTLLPNHVSSGTWCKGSSHFRLLSSVKLSPVE